MVHKIYFRLEQTAWLLYYILIRKNEGYPLSSYLPRMHPYNPTNHQSESCCYHRHYQRWLPWLVRGCGSRMMTS